MTVFLDSNIILDILLKNSDFCDESKKVLKLADTNPIDFFISATSITDIFYIAHKQATNDEKQDVKKHLQDLLEIISIAGIDESCIRNALNSSWTDFEDSVQHEVSIQIGADYIVTRNTDDYKTSIIPAIAPADFLKKFDK